MNIHDSNSTRPTRQQIEGIYTSSEMDTLKIFPASKMDTFNHVPYSAYGLGIMTMRNSDSTWSAHNAPYQYIERLTGDFQVGEAGMLHFYNSDLPWLDIRGYVAYFGGAKRVLVLKK